MLLLVVNAILIPVFWNKFVINLVSLTMYITEHCVCLFWFLYTLRRCIQHIACNPLCGVQ